MKPNSNGGLGVHNLGTFNQDLSSKLLRNFGEEETHLWRRVVIEKYEEDGQQSRLEDPMNVAYGRISRQGGMDFFLK